MPTCETVEEARNNMIVDLEISGGVAPASPVYTVYGTRGSLISQAQKTIKMRYLDPRKKLTPRTAKKGAPGDNFGTPDNLKRIEKEIPVKPKQIRTPKESQPPTGRTGHHQLHSYKTSDCRRPAPDRQDQAAIRSTDLYGCKLSRPDRKPYSIAILRRHRMAMVL